MKKVKQNSGNALIAAGFLMILSAGFITAYNINASNNAGRASKETFERFVEQVRIEPVKDEPYDVVAEYGLSEEIRGYLVNKPKENKEDPVFDIDGIEYPAVMKIPVLDIGLPVRNELTMSSLREAPCRYSGSIKGNDIIIAAHNYDSHFGRIHSLTTGDEIILTDASGNDIVYTVSETELLDGTDVADMRSGQWDLTLFTCNLSGRSRVTVRCIRKEA